MGAVEIARFLPGLVRREASEEEVEAVAAIEEGEESGTRLEEPTREKTAVTEEEAVVEDMIEETVTEVAVEAGEEREEEREPLCLPTTGGRKSPRATMEEVVEADEVETIGEVEEVVAGTAMTGPSLCQGMRGRRRNSSTKTTVRLASTLTGTRTFL